MSVAPWEFINNIQAGGTSTEGYNTFLTNRTLSSNLKMYSLRAFDFINSYEWSSVPEEVRAQITANLIRKLPRFNYKYVKNGKVVKAWQDEDVQTVMQRMECTEKDAQVYIEEGFVSQDVIDRWKDEGFYK